MVSTCEVCGATSAPTAIDIADDPTVPKPIARRIPRWAVGVSLAVVALSVASAVFIGSSSDHERSINPDSDTTEATNQPVIFTPEVQSESVPTMQRIIGQLPNGDRYVIEAAPTLSSAVVAVSGVPQVVLSGSDDGVIVVHTLGLAKIVPADSGLAADSATDSAASFSAMSGAWRLLVPVDEAVLNALGADGLQSLLEATVGVGGAGPSGLPAFDLKDPLVWADDGPLSQMAVTYDGFEVRRGCQQFAIACSPFGSIQIVPTDPTDQDLWANLSAAIQSIDYSHDGRWSLSASSAANYGLATSMSLEIYGTAIRGDAPCGGFDAVVGGGPESADRKLDYCNLPGTTPAQEFIDALTSEPTRIDDKLIFDTGTVHLVFQRNGPSSPRTPEQSD